jgi:RNA polymerase sigma factor (sigma-70 family)
LFTISEVSGRGAQPESDGVLVLAVRAGDLTAFETLYRAHVGAVQVVARSHVRDPDSVADIVQDSFARALQHLGALREVDRFRPWLLSIARHASVDHLRLTSRVVALDDDHANAIPSAEASPDDVAELNELARRVQGCVTGLSQRDATVVAMVTQLGFTPTQIAAALDVTPGAAKVIAHRARRRMRSALMLELMVEQPDLGCAEFHSLRHDDPSAASRHLVDCEDCIASAGAELVSTRRGPLTDQS